MLFGEVKAVRAHGLAVISESCGCGVMCVDIGWVALSACGGMRLMNEGLGGPRVVVQDVAGRVASLRAADEEERAEKEARDGG